MISKTHFVNKIRELGYSYKSQHKRIDLWRKSNGTHFISVPRSDKLEDEFVIASLRQAGLSLEDIKAFIGVAKS